MRTRLTLFLGLFLVANATLAHAQAAPPPPPEVKKTVDALVGNWTLAATMAAPGQAKPTKFTERFHCKKVSGGRGVSCSDTATVPGMGKLDFTHLIAFDPERKAVHWYAVGSTGEVHDHTCHWTDEHVLTCDQLKATMGGQPITEDLTITFDGNKHTWAVTVGTKDGPIKIDAVGKRSGK